jgi:hypothetical protein
VQHIIKLRNERGTLCFGGGSEYDGYSLAVLYLCFC